MKDLPLFPLGTVLFPGGLLPLRVFEQRYLEMAKSCLREESPFGVCLIREGVEVGAPATPEPVGCLAHIVQWDMQQLGLLQIVAQGGARFRILERRLQADGLARASVELLPAEVDNLGRELGIEVRIIRPGAFVDYAMFDPPGLLGKRVGNIYVAIGSPRETLAVADIQFTADTLIWVMEHFGEAPPALHLMDPARPTKADLVQRLRQTNPDLSVIWLPRLVLVPLSWMAIVLQKVLRPRHAALNVAKTFARQRYDDGLIAQLAPAIRGGAAAPAPEPETVGR